LQCPSSPPRQRGGFPLRAPDSRDPFQLTFSFQHFFPVYSPLSPRYPILCSTIVRNLVVFFLVIESLAHSELSPGSYPVLDFLDMNVLNTPFLFSMPPLAMRLHPWCQITLFFVLLHNIFFPFFPRSSLNEGDQRPVIPFNSLGCRTFSSPFLLGTPG